jgi:hypothetical protein
MPISELVKMCEKQKIWKFRIETVLQQDQKLFWFVSGSYMNENGL